MKHKNRQILSMLLSLCMVLSLFAGTTVTAGAADTANAAGPTTLYVNGQNMLDGGTVDNVTYDAGTATLTLDGATLDTFHVDTSVSYAKKAGVIYFAGGSLTIELQGKNTIIFGDASEDLGNAGGIFFEKGDLTITGNGTLTIQNKATNPNGDGYQYFSGIYAYGNYQNEANLSIEGGAVVKCTAIGSKLTGSVYGVNVAYGTLTVDSSTLSITTKDSTKGNYGIYLGSERTHKLTGNTTVTVVAGQCDESSNSWGIEPGYESSIQIGAGAKLYASGQAFAFRDNGTIKAADDAALSVKGSADYNKTSADLTEINVTNNQIGTNDIQTYKTIEITASAGSTPTPPSGSGSGLDFTGDAWKAGCTQNGTLWTSADGTWSWDTAANTLTLTNCTIEATEADSNGIKFPDDADVQLVLKGENHVSAAGGSAIKGNADKTLTISGDGSLEAKTGQSNSAIVSCGNLVLESGAVNLVKTSEYIGINVSNLTVNGGTLSSKGFYRAIMVTGEVTINGGHVTALSTSGGAISGTTTDKIRVKVGMTIKGGTDAGSAKIIDTIGNQNYLEITAPAPAAPTFTDGFGNVVTDTSEYVKDSFKNEKDYTFGGWVDADGNVVDSAADAVAGKVYTAKWTKDGNTVRTEVLELDGMPSTDNTAEGWSWDAASKTLTLKGATFDVNGADTPAIMLPDGATLTTAAGTQNSVSMSSGNFAYAIGGIGDITIDGKGSLTAAGEGVGIIAEGNIAIKAPITVDGALAAIAVESQDTSCKVTIDSSLYIKTPDGGKISDDGKAVVESDGKTFAKKVVIAKSAPSGTVTGVKVTPEGVTLSPGGSQQFTAAVTGTGSYDQTVKWTVLNQTSKATTITSDGLLTVGADETAKEISVIATSNADANVFFGLPVTIKQTAGFTVSGTVTEKQADDSTKPVDGADVELKQGSKVIASAKTGANGTYSFVRVPDGNYNIIVTSGSKTMTKLIAVSGKDQTGIDITLPKEDVSSVVEVKNSTPAVIVGGLDQEAESKAEAGSIVEVKLSVDDASISAALKQDIKAISSGRTLQYLDMTVQKTVTPSGGTPGTTSINETATVLEIVVPFTTSGRNRIMVYRNHTENGTSETKALTSLSTRPAAPYQDGTFFVGDGFVVIYAQKFSTYAIGYNTSSSGGGSSSAISTPSVKNGTVSVNPRSASKGSTVTVTVTPDKGYTLETLTVTDQSGNQLDLKNLGDGKYTFTMPSGKVEVKAAFMEDNSMLNYFVDVPASAYYYDAVLWAAEQGITGGTDATHFSPDGVCTRAQAVTFLWRAAGSPAPSATAMPFTDVAADSYYYNAVLWAMENGITVGTSSTTFSPDLTCSRAQIVTFLWRSEKSPAAGSVNPFTDISADAYYADAVLWAVKESVTSGTSPATFSPDADCTRAQIVTFIWRTLAR